MNFENPNNLRVIKTARSEKAINQAAKEGYWPLVKPVKALPEIHSKYSVVQHKETGEIEVIADFRSDSGRFGSNGVTIIPFTQFYPYQFANPYAAYLVPSDLKPGDEVFLEDLIEDLIGSTWNQGDTYRLEGSEAMWNGKVVNIDLNNFKV